MTCFGCPKILKGFPLKVHGLILYLVWVYELKYTLTVGSNNYDMASE